MDEEIIHIAARARFLRDQAMEARERALEIAFWTISASQRCAELQHQVALRLQATFERVARQPL
jgi:hypothetical protein